MKLNNEIEESVYKFDLDLSIEEYNSLRELALKEITKDDDALINYAVNHLLRQACDDIEAVNKFLSEKKEEKNESKS